MRAKRLHGWQLNPAQAIAWQHRLAGQVCRDDGVTMPRFIAGVDMAAGRAQDMAVVAIIVLSFPELKVVAMEVIQGALEFPYIPGLLSFRESPLMLMAGERLSITPDLVIVDGQGVAHPRRFGLAAHLGLLWDIPTIGCAKSPLCGQHEEPGPERGSYTAIIDRGETIGAVVRTRHGVKPVYVSIGHKVDLPAAIHWVLECCRGYRLPEPTRLAHLAAGGNLKSERTTVTPEVGNQREPILGVKE